MKIDYTSADYNGFKEQMISALQSRIPEYTDTSETDVGIVIFEAVSTALDIISYYQNVQANECFLSTAERRSNVMKFSRMLGYTPRSCTPAKYVEHIVVDYASIVKAGGTVLKRNSTFRTDSPDIEYFSTLADLSIPLHPSINDYVVGRENVVGVDTEANTVTFAVDIAHGTEVSEIVSLQGGVDVTLKFSPVPTPDYDSNGFAVTTDISRNISISDGSEKGWKLKNTLIDSTNTDKHFLAQVNEDNTITLVFGDGSTGGVKPTWDLEVHYRQGGGTAGNVGARTINFVGDLLFGGGLVRVLSVTNPESYYSAGTDKETLADIKVNAPNAYRTRWGCFQTGDYGQKALEIFGDKILMANAYVKLDREPFDPEHEEQSFKNVDTICLCVVPMGDIYNEDESRYNKLADFNELLSVDLKSVIEEALQERALVGTYVEVDGFESKGLEIDCSLLPTREYDSEDGRRELLENVSGYLAECFAIGNIKAGQTVSLYDIETLVMENVLGVRAFRITDYVATSSDTDEDTPMDVTSKPWEIIELNKVTINDTVTLGGTENTDDTDTENTGE